MTPAQRRRGRFGIQARVLSLAVLFTLFTAGIIIFSSARSLAQQLRRTTIQSAEYTLQAAASGIRKDIQEVDDLSLWCCVDSTIRTAMLTDISTGVLTHTVYPIIANKYNSMHTAPYIQRFLLASQNGRIIMMGTASSQSRAVGQEALGLLPGMAEGEPLARWDRIQKDPLMQFGIVMEGIPITRQMVRGPSQYAASVYLSVSPALITDPLRALAPEDGSWLCWVMGGTLYRVEDGGLVPLGEADGLLTGDPADPDTLGAGTAVYTARFEEADYTAVVCPLGLHELSLGLMLPQSKLPASLYLLRGPALIALAVVLVMGLGMALLLQRTVAVPIGQLQRRIAKVSEGDFSTDAGIEWNHELGDVGRGINHLSQSVSDLMARRVEDEKQQLDLEYRMLQNQISPHFIYNTLNSIKWMATIQHAPGVAEMVTALSRLLKSVSKGNQRLVPLAEEFGLLEDYFTIQRYRYGGTLTLSLPAAGELAAFAGYRIPRFTLQPLAENAIFHGIEPKGGVGSLSVSLAAGEGGDLLLRLADDGVGMPQEQIGRILAGPQTAGGQQARFRHVGVWNVHRLLQLSFGPQYGLAIESGPAGGTTVTLRLPRPAEAAPDRTEAERGENPGRPGLNAAKPRRPNPNKRPVKPQKGGHSQC